jgi:hypothetical protein
MSELSGPARSPAIMPGSSKDAHGLVPSLIDGIARKIVEMDNPIAIAMISLAFMVGAAPLRSLALAGIQAQ